jgi:hypothetical protein
MLDDARAAFAFAQRWGSLWVVSVSRDLDYVLVAGASLSGS